VRRAPGGVTKAVLRFVGRSQRPVAWVTLLAGIIYFVGVATQVIAAEEPALSLAIALLSIQQGWAAVAEVENELDSEAAAEE
jgi:uncharacterized membrane protein